MLNLLTPTGDRPEAFKLCERWMSQQSVPYRWIVVDDGRSPTNCTKGQIHIIRKRGPHEPKHTLPLNIAAGLARYTGGPLAIIEDDDYYGPTYLRDMIENLGDNPMVGVANAIYYNLRYRSYRMFDNNKHASFCQTVLSEKAIPALREAIKKVGDPYIDLAIWKAIGGHLVSLRSSIGIKGMPGRFGIGVGHKAYDFTYDPDLYFLRKCLGPDAAHYLPYIGAPSRPIEGVRRLDDGTYYLPRPNAKLESQLDTTMERVPNELRWRIKVYNADLTIFRNMHLGETAHIIGKGPSLDEIETLPCGPVFCLNQAIHRIESLALPNKLYCVQQDVALGEACLPLNATLLLSSSANNHYVNYLNKYVYNPADLGLQPSSLTALVAIAFAKLAGCKKIKMWGFDAAKGDTRYAESLNAPGVNTRFFDHWRVIKKALDGLEWSLELPHDHPPVDLGLNNAVL